MGFFSSAGKKLGGWAARGVEILNLKTESKLKDISNLPHEVVLQKNGATRRSVSSTVLGTALNIAIAVACPPFVAAAALNVWQLGVSATNRHRVRREIETRRKEHTGFELLYKKNNHRFRDIAVGCTVKAAFTALSAGIIGFDHIADGFSAIAQHGITHAASQGTMDGATNAVPIQGKSTVQHIGHDTSTTTDKVYNSSGDGVTGREKELLERHPRTYVMDQKVHKAFSLPDIFAKSFGSTGQGVINTDISWDQLGELIENGVSRTEAYMKAAVIGSFMELAQPIAQLYEYNINKWFELKDSDRVKAYYKTYFLGSPFRTQREENEHVRNETAVVYDISNTVQHRCSNEAEGTVQAGKAAEAPPGEKSQLWDRRKDSNHKYSPFSSDNEQTAYQQKEGAMLVELFSEMKRRGIDATTE